MAAILFRNTRDMDNAVDRRKTTGRHPDPHLLPFPSPLGREPVILTGDAGGPSGARERTVSRPLNPRPGQRG